MFRTFILKHKIEQYVWFIDLLLAALAIFFYVLKSFEEITCIYTIK